MVKPLVVLTVLVFGVSICLTVSTERAEAQGPAGAGASAVAQESSHSFNPMHWVRKDTNSSAGVLSSRSDAEKKLTPQLQTQGLLAENVTATEACAPFGSVEECLGALHASHNLGLDFNCLRADMTGVHTAADVSHCKVADGEKAQGLHKAIHQLKPEANVKEATKEAEQQARDDLKAIGG